MPEMSLLGFIGHLAAVRAELDHHEHKGMERAAQIIETEAKAEIGTYQGAAGPFAEWVELADATKDDRAKQGFDENQPGLRRGDMRDSISHAVEGKEAAVGSDDEKMVWFELGTDRQPPRSVLGTAAVHKGHEAALAVGGSLVTALVGRDVFGGRLPIP